MLEPILCGRLAAAPLLPKLRGHFAEFLDNASSVGLGILSPSTCVGLRYGCVGNDSGFSRRMAHGLPYYRLRYPSHLPIPRGVLPPRLVPCLGRAFRSRLPPPTRVPTFLSHRSTGISTCRPSATAPALALGPDSPRADQLYPGDLGYSAIRILTLFSLLIPAFSLACPPRLLSVPLRRARNAPLPTLSAFPSFGGTFQPRTFSARNLSTSELLRTL